MPVKPNYPEFWKLTEEEYMCFVADMEDYKIWCARVLLGLEEDNGK